MNGDAPLPLLLDLAHPLDARHAPGGSSVDLTLYPVGGAAPVCVRLHGSLVQLLIASVRRAAAAPPDAPMTDGDSPSARLAEAFSWVLQRSRAASSSSTSARNAGTSNSAAIASSEGAARSSTV